MFEKGLKMTKKNKKISKFWRLHSISFKLRKISWIRTLKQRIIHWICCPVTLLKQINASCSRKYSSISTPFIKIQIFSVFRFPCSLCTIFENFWGKESSKYLNGDELAMQYATLQKWPWCPGNGNKSNFNVSYSKRNIILWRKLYLVSSIWKIGKGNTLFLNVLSVSRTKRLTCTNQQNWEMNIKLFTNIIKQFRDSKLNRKQNVFLCLFRSIKISTVLGIEPRPVEYRPCILPLSQAALLLVLFNSGILWTQHIQSSNFLRNFNHQQTDALSSRLFEGQLQFYVRKSLKMSPKSIFFEISNFGSCLTYYWTFIKSYQYL